MTSRRVWVVEHANKGRPALIKVGRNREIGVARVDRRAAGQESMRLGQAAMVGQGAQAGRLANDVSAADQRQTNLLDEAEIDVQRSGAWIDVVGVHGRRPGKISRNNRVVNNCAPVIRTVAMIRRCD